MVPPCSDRIPRVPPYSSSSYMLLRIREYHSVPSAFPCSSTWTYITFGLFPFRSPLLRKSRLISFPQGTEMFHFPWFAFTTLGCKWPFGRVSPFGYLRLLRPLSAYLSFSQISTSFFASWRHGIHHVRLFTWPYNPGLLLVVCSLLPENILSRNLLVKTFSFTQWLIEFEFLYSACF
jgi:hypothetical protein